MKRRISRSSTCLLLPCAIEAALLGGCADVNGVDAIGDASSPIVNGAEDFLGADVGVADVRNVKAQRDDQNGTAVMLTNQWAVSAKHVIDERTFSVESASASAIQTSVSAHRGAALCRSLHRAAAQRQGRRLGRKRVLEEQLTHDQEATCAAQAAAGGLPRIIAGFRGATNINNRQDLPARRGSSQVERRV
jgi:hypothetical protein